MYVNLYFKWVKYWLETLRGALATFATEGTSSLHVPVWWDIIPFVTAMGFSEQFPGITPHLLTLASNFKVPFYRELLMAMGIYSVSKASCSNILKAGPGSSITIVVGGAAESLSAHPGTVNLTLRKRCVLPCCKEELADWSDRID